MITHGVSAGAIMNGVLLQGPDIEEQNCMLIDSHLARLTLASYRPSTITSRRKCLVAFEHALHGRSLPEASRLDVERFLARSLAPESRRTYRNHLRGFYRWLLDEGFISADPTEKLPPIRVPQAMPRPMSDTDISTALATATPRMRAWLTLMALAGLRCMEVAALRPADLHVTTTGTLLFLREVKGGGTASVPCHPVILQNLVHLPVRDGMWWTTSAAQVSRSVNVHLRRHGIRSTAHSLRHSAGTAWYRESGHDLLVTKELLRHASVVSTQIYAATDPTRAAMVAGMVSLPIGA